MNFFYPFFIAFSMVFVSELGDKTQLLVLSFSGKESTFQILLGVAIGSFFSHGLAILFGSSVALFENEFFHDTIEMVTYASFLVMGIVSFLPKKEILSMHTSKKDTFFEKISHLKINYCFVVALCIFIGELGDKTSLASIGLGIEYPNSKYALMAGAISAMVACDALAILCGKFLRKYISESAMQKLSGILFLLFGILGFWNVFYA